jgi:hypothetical protein
MTNNNIHSTRGIWSVLRWHNRVKAYQPIKEARSPKDQQIVIWTNFLTNHKCHSTHKVTFQSRCKHNLTNREYGDHMVGQLNLSHVLLNILSSSMAPPKSECGIIHFLVIYRVKPANTNNQIKQIYKHNLGITLKTWCNQYIPKEVTSDQRSFLLQSSTHTLTTHSTQIIYCNRHTGLPSAQFCIAFLWVPHLEALKLSRRPTALFEWRGVCYHHNFLNN